MKGFTEFDPMGFSSSRLSFALGSVVHEVKQPGMTLRLTMARGIKFKGQK